MGDLATVVGQGFYVAGTWGGGTCTAAGSATAAVTVPTILYTLSLDQLFHIAVIDMQLVRG